MIVKKVKYTNTDKPKVWQIGDLVDYIRYPHNTNAQEKIAHAGSRNFFTTTYTGQKVEMIALAEESIHSNHAGEPLDIFMAGKRAANTRPGG